LISWCYAFLLMYEFRCPNDGKKLAEIARPPLKELNYVYKCNCGNTIQGKIFIDKKQGKIFVQLSCPCGYQKIKPIGDLVFIKCKKCKKIIYF